MRDNKYDAILTAAAYLISRQGYNGTTFQEIADRVGIHKSTLYHYFISKEDLILRIMETSIEGPILNLQQIISDNELAVEEKLKKALDNHLTLLIAHADNVRIYLNELRYLSKRNQAKYLTKRILYEKDFETIIIQMKEAGYFQGLDTRIVTFGILSMLNGVAQWFKTSGRLTIKEVSHTFYQMIVQQCH